MYKNYKKRKHNGRPSTEQVNGTPVITEDMVVEEAVPEEVPETVDVLGVKFKTAGKVYYFDPNGTTAEVGDNLIVETARGLEFGEAATANKTVLYSEIVPPLRPVIRHATKEDELRHQENIKREKEAFDICVKKIAEHQLEMKLVEVEYTFDNNKLLFYFTADGRVDFRDLVKDLASVFRTRIELRQIGIRDEAKIIGGLGVCGRKYCCAGFLTDFVQVSIKMAKEQNFSLNSAKVSGACGRLMCCLRYEHETYEEAIKNTPPVGATVKTGDGTGVVVETKPLAAEIKVKLGESDKEVIKPYKCKDVKVLKMPGKRDTKDEDEENIEE